MGVSILTTNEKGKCYKQTPLFASFNTSSALHIFIFFVSYRPTRMSASTDEDVCADRRGCLRRPMRMSASTDADLCADRCGWHELMFCTYRGCTCLKCTNQPRTTQISQELHKPTKNYTTPTSVGALIGGALVSSAPTNQELHQPTKNYTTPPLLVHLRQVHPLSNCAPQARTQKRGAVI